MNSLLSGPEEIFYFQVKFCFRNRLFTVEGLQLFSILWDSNVGASAPGAISLRAKSMFFNRAEGGRSYNMFRQNRSIADNNNYQNL